MLLVCDRSNVGADQRREPRPWRRQRRANIDPERVLHVGRRMVRRIAELAEVVLLDLDLGAVVHREAEAHEHVDDLVAHDRDGVRVAERPLQPRRKREVEREPR